MLFGTTPAFLEKMGLDSLAQLPAIAEFVPGADVVEALEHGLRVDVDPSRPRSPGRRRSSASASPARTVTWTCGERPEPRSGAVRRARLRSEGDADPMGDPERGSYADDLPDPDRLD